MPCAIEKCYSQIRHIEPDLGTLDHERYYLTTSTDISWTDWSLGRGAAIQQKEHDTRQRRTNKLALYADQRMAWLNERQELFDQTMHALDLYREQFSSGVAPTATELSAFQEIQARLVATANDVAQGAADVASAQEILATVSSTYGIVPQTDITEDDFVVIDEPSLDDDFVIIGNLPEGDVVLVE